MKALIDIRIGRVCEIHAEEFPVDPRSLIWVECDLSVTVQHTYDVGEGVFVDPVAEAEPELEWDDKRREDYGSVKDQLDEIYHDIDAWKLRIAGVKTSHPKP